MRDPSYFAQSYRIGPERPLSKWWAMEVGGMAVNRPPAAIPASLTPKPAGRRLSSGAAGGG